MSASRKLRRYRGWIAAGALAAIAAIAFYVFGQSGVVEPTTTYTTEAVTTGTVSVTVSGTGNLEIDGTTDVWASAAGTVGSISVAKGDSVATGTVLFTLDASSAQAETSRALASYRQAQQGVAQAEASLAKAENTLADLETQYAEQTTASAAASTAADTAVIVSSQAAAPEDSSASSPADTQTTIEVTQADIDAAELDVASAEAGLSSAKASQSSALLTYEQARENESNLTVAAPGSGVVHELNIEVGDSVSSSSGGSTSAGASTDSAASATSGSTSGSGAPVILAPQQPLAVHLTVNEVDLPTLEVGQRADIEFDAFPDLTATGKVYEIADEGTNTQGVVTFDVWLSLDVVDSRLRSGMSSAATIVTEVASNTLVIPNSAVKSDEDYGSYALVMEPGATEPQQVPLETGLASATYAQVLSGLEAGDEVVTQTSESDAEDTAADSGGFSMPGMGGGPPR